MSAHVRPEAHADRAATRAVNVAAFGGPVEADIVDALRGKVEPLVSLVAEVERTVVGHILFSPVSLSGHPTLSVMGLGPMAVLPARQREGIGSALVRAGLERCSTLGCEAVVVLGHPGYYPRFGFLPAKRYGISSEYDVPDDVFMVLELRADALRGAAGRIRYDEAFGGA